MKIFAAHGVRDFVICAGTKGYVIKEYFANYVLHNSDVTVDLASNRVTLHQKPTEDWRVAVVDTGEETATGGRLRRVRDRLPAARDFLFTYGDSVLDVDVGALLALHRERGKLATMTAVQPPSKYGVLAFAGDRIDAFQEKPAGEGGWINGGFFVLRPAVIEWIDDDDTPWEHEPMQRLVAAKELSAYHHRGFWHNVDTQRDWELMEELWEAGRAPWRVWA
jgi:glucose-1-phosphate cytidylyltransferase